VHRSKYEEFIQKAAAALQQFKIGSPLDESSIFGPLSNKPHFEKVKHYLDIAHQNNQIICGGKVIAGTGYFVEPTLLTVWGIDDPLFIEETFGPVVDVIAFESDEELISMMNHSRFGLTASIWTNDLAKALRLIPQIEAGSVWVNMHTFLDPAVPFGGVKASGLGREFSDAFIEDYTELKSVMIRY
jgi:phenylacetaldehyde dehydrogenase